MVFSILLHQDCNFWLSMLVTRMSNGLTSDRGIGSATLLRSPGGSTLDRIAESVTLQHRGKHNAYDSAKLDQNVESRTRGVLKGITNGITGDGVLVGLRTLGMSRKTVSLNVLLGVIPSTSRVGHRDGQLDTTGESTEEDTCSAVLSEHESEDDGGEDDKSTGGDHFLDGSSGGNRDASGIVRGMGTRDDTRELLHALRNHVLSGNTNRSHGHTREDVGHQSTNEETSEGPRVEQVELSNTRSHAESSEKSYRHESSGTNGETLTDSGSGVTSSVQSVSLLTGGLSDLSHLSNTTGIVRDRTVGVNSQRDGQSREHTQSSERNTIHSAELVSDQSASGSDQHGDDVGVVTQRQTEDDTSSSRSALGFGDLSYWSVAVRSVVLGHDTNDQTTPKTHQDRDSSLPPLHAEGLTSVDNDEVTEAGGIAGEGQTDDDRCHQNGRYEEQNLEGSLDLSKSGDGENESHYQNRHETHNDTHRRDKQREHELAAHEIAILVGIGELLSVTGVSQQQEGSASRLSEGAEKISTHTCDITNVITDIIGNASGISRVILVHTVLVLSRQVSTNVGSLGVDTSGNSGEESDGGTSQTVTGESGKDVLHLRDVLVILRGSCLGGDPGQNDEHSDVEAFNTQRNESKTHDGTTTESGLEPLCKGAPALVASADIAHDGCLHANETAGTRGDGTDDESNSGLPSSDKADNDSETDNVEGQPLVLLNKERSSTIGDMG